MNGTDMPAGIRFRDAGRNDIAAVVRLLAADVLGSTREAVMDEVDPAYVEAFEAIVRDPNNRLIVADVEGEVVGCMQITCIPNMTFKGGRRLQIEGVRVGSSVRGQGLGRTMIGWAIDLARVEKCRLVQLTTNRARDDAMRFYEELGFESTHIGYKMYLE